MALDFDSLYAHYQTTGNIIPLVDAAPKAANWGHGSPPQFIHLLPSGQALLDALKAAYEDETPLPAELEWADWPSVPKDAKLFT